MGATLLWFAISSGGLVLSLAVGALWLWTRPSARGPRRFLVAVLVAYGLASLYPVPHAVARLMGAGFRPLTREDVPPGRSLIVLLGSGNHTRVDWTGATLSVLDPIAAERTLEAARIYRIVQPAWVISSGGIVHPEDNSVPSGELMRDTLVTLGVPRDRILVEGISRTTRDEAVIVAEMIHSLPADQLILITSQLHMRRSLGVFRAAGLTAIPAVARDWMSGDWAVRHLPTDTGLRLSALVAHELMGTAYYWLRGWYR